MRGLKYQLGDKKVQIQLLTVDQLRQMYHTSVVSDQHMIVWYAVFVVFRSLL